MNNLLQSDFHSLPHDDFMRLAMQQAQIAVDHGGFPVGWVAVDESGQILYQDHDRVVEYMDPSAHTEVNIIRFLCKSRRTTKLKDIALYVTSEPCPVCMGLIIRTKIPFVVYGCDTEPNASLPIPAKDILKHAYVQSTQLLGGVLADECLAQRNASVKSEG